MSKSSGGMSTSSEDEVRAESDATQIQMLLRIGGRSLRRAQSQTRRARQSQKLLRSGGRSLRQKRRARQSQTRPILSRIPKTKNRPIPRLHQPRQRLTRRTRAGWKYLSLVHLEPWKSMLRATISQLMLQHVALASSGKTDGNGEKLYHASIRRRSKRRRGLGPRTASPCA